MKKEKVLIFLKPDGVELGLRGTLLEMLSKAEIIILEEHTLFLTEVVIKTLYSSYQEAWFFGQLVDYLTSGPSLLVVCEGADANLKVKEIRGNSYYGNGLRGKYASCRVPDPNGRPVFLKNVVHVSDPDDFQKEYTLLKTQVV